MIPGLAVACFILLAVIIAYGWYLAGDEADPLPRREPVPPPAVAAVPAVQPVAMVTLERVRAGLLALPVAGRLPMIPPDLDETVVMPAVPVITVTPEPGNGDWLDEMLAEAAAARAELDRQISDNEEAAA